jgi:hypothetical protein
MTSTIFLEGQDEQEIEIGSGTGRSCDKGDE